MVFFEMRLNLPKATFVPHSDPHFEQVQGTFTSDADCPFLRVIRGIYCNFGNTHTSSFRIGVQETLGAWYKA